jgi:S1-C subfamily serine protease
MRRIPDDNLAYPVLVKIGTSSGSGFFLNTPTAVYLVTAYHVLYDSSTSRPFASTAELASYPRNPADNGRNVFAVDVAALDGAGEIKTDTTRDLAVFRIALSPEGSDTVQALNAITIVSLSSSGILGLGIQNVRLYADVLTSNDVFLFGYPVSLGLQHIPQIDYTRPLLRSGIVAGKNESLKTIILDCPVYPGNSGGPVLEVEEEGFRFHFRCIGVVTQYVPAVAPVVGTAPTSGAGAIVNSGYSVAASMDGVLALAQQ